MRNLFLFLTITMACSPGHSDSNAGAEITDSAKLILTREEKEKAIFDYYQSIEREVKNDLGVPKGKIAEHIQSLIDEGHVQKPVIFIDTGHGIELMIVDYMTYKDFSRKDPTDFAKRYELQRKMPDSLFYDSMRSYQVEVRKADITRKTQ